MVIVPVERTTAERGDRSMPRKRALSRKAPVVPVSKRTIPPAVVDAQGKPVFPLESRRPQ
jgi:hypothetical protein